MLVSVIVYMVPRIVNDILNPHVKFTTLYHCKDMNKDFLMSFISDINGEQQFIGDTNLFESSPKI